MNYFSEIEKPELDKIIEEETNINKLKILLANKTTEILHGKKAAKESEETAEETFQKKGIGKNLPEILIKKSLFKKVN